MWDIFVHRLNFSPDAVVGVSLIGIYFVVIVWAAAMRIKRGEHMHH